MECLRWDAPCFYECLSSKEWTWVECLGLLLIYMSRGQGRSIIIIYMGTICVDCTQLSLYSRIKKESIFHVLGQWYIVLKREFLQNHTTYGPNHGTQTRVTGRELSKCTHTHTHTANHLQTPTSECRRAERSCSRLLYGRVRIHT